MEDSNRSSEMLLARSYVYQNRKTGLASSSALTVRQLCRVLSPAHGVESQQLTPDTMVLGFDDTGQYASEGWKTAKSLPVLLECCAQWYYLDPSDKKKVKGPVSCRELARLLFKQEETVTLDSKVWTEQQQPTGQQRETEEAPQKEQPTWRPIQDLPYLRAALDAFDTTPPPSWKLESGHNNVESNKKAASNGTTATGLLPNGNQYDASIMTFKDDEKPPAEDGQDNTAAKEIQDELEAFLSSTADMGPSHIRDDEDEEVGYESDGGTAYVKDRRTGNWIHEALAPPKPKEAASVKSKQPKPTPHQNTTTSTTSKKRNKPKFSAKNAKNWIYVTGLPTDCDQEEVTQFFSKVGIIDLDPETQNPKVKLYRHKPKEGGADVVGKLKGDASICYARPESVELALQLLDESQFRPSAIVQDQSAPPPIRVQRAKFEQHGDTFDKKRNRVSDAKRKVARLAAIQAVDWDDGDNGRISGGRKGLHIIVLKHMFDPAKNLAKDEDAFLAQLEREVHEECEEWGAVEKITVFSKNVDGVVIVKFGQPKAATTAIKEYDGRMRNGRRVDAHYWDGVTDYTVRDEEKEQEEMKKRHDEFGNWLENQELPEEFRLQVEGHS